MEHQFASRTSEEKNYNQTDGTDLLNNNDGLSFSPPALQFKSFGDLEEDESIQKKGDANAVATSNKLPPNILTKMENSFDQDFSKVDIHPNSDAASNLKAQAFTQGNEIHFASGKYDPNSKSGQELIGHELTHVVQQKEGKVEPNTSSMGLPVNDNPHLEQEADLLGAKAAAYSTENEEE